MEHGDIMIEILGTEIEREDLTKLMETITPWDCMYSPETLTDIYIRSGPDSIRLRTALGEDWLEDDMVYVTLQKIDSQQSGDDFETETILDKQLLADARSSGSQPDSGCEFVDADEMDFEDNSYLFGSL
jgi:hypothetical protein